MKSETIPVKVEPMLRNKPYKRLLFLTLLASLIVIRVVLFSPKHGDEPKTAALTHEIEPITADFARFAPGIPQNRIPEYAVDQFHYVSVHQGEKQWKIQAEKAFLYHPEQLVHSHQVVASLYDSEGKITLIHGLESKYYLDQKQLEVFGHVTTRFPDGFEFESEYLSYSPGERKIFIPTEYLTHGKGHEAAGQSFEFTSQGLQYRMGDSWIELSQQVLFTLKKNRPLPQLTEKTQIQSDHCWIDRSQSLAQFRMNPERPDTERFVQIHQPTLFVKARKADLRYRDFSQILQSLSADEDVLVIERSHPADTDQAPLRYATGGRADFDTNKQVIELTQFPQVYQDSNTVTGNRIRLYRNTDTVEIERSNSFSEGIATGLTKNQKTSAHL